jgi:hypothetical protein
MTSASSDALRVRAAAPHQDKAAVSSGMSAARAIAGGLVGIVGVAILVAGILVVGLHLFDRDGDGYYPTDAEAIQTDTHAVSTQSLAFGTGPIDAPDGLFGQSRLSVEAVGGRSVFVGVGSSDEVDLYLSGVSDAEVSELGNGELDYDLRPGHAPASAPGDQSFWIAKAEGSGRQVLDWDVEKGEWTAVVMNADGSRGIATEVTAGLKNGWLVWAAVGMIVLGALTTFASARILHRRPTG